jgi:ATPase subunit of ABC transporter with duplicated ATPase domains
MSTENKVIYSMIGVSKFYDKKPVLKDIYLSYFYGAKIGVIGLNGSGKSSLLRILAGVDQDHLGETVISPGYTVGHLEQEPLIDDSRTVREVVEEAVQETVNLLKEFEEINAKFGEEMSDDEMNTLLERQGIVQEKLDHLDAWDLDSRLEMAMDALRCPPPDTSVKILSGGERRRVALCRLLLQKPDILLLDEPTNHLDAESVAWLEHHLQNYAGTIIAVTHDRYFLDRVATQILALDGAGHAEHYNGDYTEYHDWKAGRTGESETAVTAEESSKSGAGRKTKSVPPAAAGGSHPHSKTAKATRSNDSKKVRVVKKPRDSELIESEISQLEKRLSDLTKEMGKPEVARDITRLVKANEDYEETEARLAELMDEWERAEAGTSKR